MLPGKVSFFPFLYPSTFPASLFLVLSLLVIPLVFFLFFSLLCICDDYDKTLLNSVFPWLILFLYVFRNALTIEFMFSTIAELCMILSSSKNTVVLTVSKSLPSIILIISSCSFSLFTKYFLLSDFLALTAFFRACHANEKA